MCTAMERCAGSTPWIHALGRTTYDDARQPLRMMGVCIDITERKQAEAKIAHLAYHDQLIRLPNRLLVLDRLSQPYQLGTHAYRCTTRIGVTLVNDNQQAIDELMKQADIAMYQAKKAGRNALRFFDPQMQKSITARVSLEGDLRNALERQQFPCITKFKWTVHCVHWELRH